MKTLSERLEMVENKIKEPNFLQNKGLGNEVGYYVFDYDPKDELEIREQIRRWKDKYNKSNSNFQILVFDLYQIVIDILINEGFLEQCFEFEKEHNFNFIIKAINEMLCMSEVDTSNEILSHIKKNSTENSVIFLTGIGKCFPILRSHKVLNNMHQFIYDVPVVLFFPGEYNGQELVLFNELKDDNYYRAFRLVD